MARGFSRKLRQELKKYYEYYGDRKAEPIRWIKTTKYGPVLLVHFIDTQGRQDVDMAGILWATEHKDGSVELHEVVTDFCNHEGEMISDFMIEANCENDCGNCKNINCESYCADYYEEDDGYDVTGNRGDAEQYADG